ncbi:Lrp/AsnC family transcriptional regulator [Melioribacteraceae bacterium 4301-Me]|uniref:Lrp/AsnC family transcriptional regulator n=1 Tax=Pyranulibacter aquaticus TaxID=3163344 RepID=UPI003597AA2A
MLDDLDIKVLRKLQQNGRTKRNELAEEVNLSIPSLSERLRKLEENKVIEGYYAKLNRHVFGYDIMAFIVVIMDSSKNYDKLTEHVKKTPEILECYSVLGEGSHIMKAVAKNTEELEKLLGKIQSWPGVTRTVTSFVLSTIKETTSLDI